MRSISRKRELQIIEEKALKKERCKLISASWLSNDYGQEYCIGHCEGCGERRVLQLSHTTPKGMGGTTHKYTVDEVRLLCDTCHKSKEHGIKVVE